MTHIYSAGGSRRSAVFTAIIGLHFAVYLIVASIQIPVPPDKALESGPITVKLPEPLELVLVPPETPGPVEPADYKPTKPIIIFPTFNESEPAPNAPSAGEGVNQEGVAPQRAPVERMAASLQGPSKSFADVIRACYPPGARRDGEEGKVLIAVMIGVQGQARSWRMVQSSGFQRLDAAVPCVLDKLKFNAAREDGRAVQSEVLLPIVFRLD